MNIPNTISKVSLARICSLLLSFVGIVYFSRSLGPSTLGIFFLFQALLEISALPANLGLRVAVEKRISEKKEVADRILATSIVLKIFLLAPIVLVCIYFSNYINEYIGIEAAVLLVAGIGLRESAELSLTTLRGELRVDETAVLQFMYVITWICVGILLVSQSFGAIGLIYSVLIGRGLQSIWGIHKINTKIGYPSISQARSLVSYSKYSVLPQVGGQIENWMDILIIGLILSQSDVGAYEVAWRVAGPILVVTGAVGTTIFPQISSWSESGDIHMIEDLLNRMITPSFIFVFPAIFGGILLSYNILTQIFGAEFAIAQGALIILLVGLIPRATRQITGKTLLGLDKPKLVTISTIIDITLNLILNIILISHFGLIGAALGTTISLTVGMLIQIHYLNKLISIKIPYLELTACLLSSALMSAIVILAMRAYEVSNTIQLFAIVGASAICYISLISISPPLKPRIQGFVKELISMS